MIVRAARIADAEAIAAIYAHHVAHGTATFDTEAPPVTFWTTKLTDFAARGWPFLVGTREDQITGYAYAAQFRDRPAYAHTCENSIYVDPAHLGQGIGKTLLAALLDASADAGFREMIAVIGGSEPASVALHTALGFRHAGRMERVGQKFGRLLDTVYMQRSLSDLG